LETGRSRVRECRPGERGFTLPEVMIVIVIMGILFGIATVSWFGVVESRAVDSATNQVASDLRLAHTRATNQLVDWGVTTNLSTYPGIALPAGVPASDYYLIRIPASGSLTLADVIGRDFPSEGAETEIASSTPLAIRFRPDGTAQAVGPGVTTVRVHVQGDPYDSNPRHDITVNTTTSRVQIVDS
jgi:type IV fimbrial biogenesis protein FimT